jgi:hypothetical protein
MVQQGTQTVTPPPTDPDMLSQPTVGQRAAAGAAPPPAAPPPSTPAAAPAASGPAKGGDEPDSKKYRLMAFIKALSGGGTPAINASLEQHYARQRAQAQLAEQQVQQLANAYAAEKDPAKRQELAHQWETAKENYLKVIGKDKNAKGIGQKTIGVLEKLVGHGGGGMTGGAAGAASPQGGGGGGAAPAASGGGGGAAPTQQGSQTVPPPPQLATAPKPTVPPPPGSNTPWQLDAMGAPERERERLAGEKEQGEIRTKDVEYRDKLKADADPQYHVNPLKQDRDDIKSAFPDMTDADVEKAVLTKNGVIPKGAGKEMQPDFKDGMLVGVKDPATNSYYTDPKTMPPEAKAIYDSAKKVEAAKTSDAEDKEDRRFRKQMELQSQSLQNALARSDYVAAQKEVKKARSDYDGALDRQTTMHENYESALKGDQQAMLSLVANHIGMTLGAQKGARITRAVWDEATSSLPWLQKVEAKFDSRGYLSGVTLAPEQMKSMVQLADQKVDILKDHVGRVQDEYADELGRKTVPPPPDGKSGGRIKVTAEDMANAK